MDYTIHQPLVIPIIVSEPSLRQRRKAWLLIAKFLLFLGIRAYPFGLRCSEKNFTGFQQVQEFFHPALLRGVTHLYETAEVLLLQGAAF